ncbi:MAG: hypothetical protein Fur0037_18660 [Planctomycetota bacterium]
MSTTRIAGAALALCSMAAAQQFTGFIYNVSTSATSRGSLGGNAGEVIARIDADDYAGWANDPANPAQRLISAITCVVQDQNAVATPETFDVKIYSEDPANPGYPLSSSGVVAVAGVPGPPAPASGTIAAAVRTLAFGTPVPVAVGSDVFVSFAVPAAAWTSDGLSFHISLGYQPSSTFTVWDEPGPAMQPFHSTNVQPSESYALNYFPATSSFAYSTRRQIRVDVATGAAAGSVTAVTNQTSYTISNTPPGTASFLSGLHPDAANPPYNVGRADDIGYRFFHANIPDLSPVFFLVSLGAFGPEISLSSFVPGSVGVGCLNLALLSPLGVGFTTSGMATKTIAIPAPARSILSGWTLSQQAIAFDPTSGALVGGPCGRQLF